MVMISHSHRFIYLKTFKTASTSTEAALERFCAPAEACADGVARDAYDGPEGIIGSRGPAQDASRGTWYGHMPAADVRDALPRAVWDGYFKFTTLRNPFERLVSHFAMRNRAHFAGRVSQDDRRTAFVDWLHHSPQATQDLDIYGIDGTPVIDAAVRLEHLAQDRAALCARLDLGTVDWPHLRNNPERWAKVGDWRALYTPRALARVADLYHWELAEYGYHAPALETSQTTD
ncbi:Sulfotransferase family protein [Pseudosulfitobacter pseudonitzschiae]|uniref:Sulfotransferase family protein n=1 Tax=Pseudosulfitobacter pseudonitzschiae TaxID=1402135 RepID=A0A073J2M9_9RHOB|nr:sulfotransferase family 2 domain-containing protein [Pseudosulfitobacter pseudonitzschiae]KEJ96065.1 hypothetical protein SUH3_17540 [Pseudosulfitobacter pseudonitzschiae]QKS09776.1 sulfotransferase family 2 domain-containing protein [Pseudosulfitobacter pseudonitzschiae]SHE96057.1 Sulfotransferase family protein [Pseudosulfitobacter pseudonitzschiae]